MSGDLKAGARPKLRGRPKLAHTLAAEAAGLSKHQTKTALRVAALPHEEFERLVEGERPPTVTELAEMGLSHRGATPRRDRPHNLSAVFRGASDAECRSRLRELRAISLLLCGRSHPLTIALRDAVANLAEIDRALDEIGALPALRRRKVLACLAALLPG